MVLPNDPDLSEAVKEAQHAQEEHYDKSAVEPLPVTLDAEHKQDEEDRQLTVLKGVQL